MTRSKAKSAAKALTFLTLALTLAGCSAPVPVETDDQAWPEKIVFAGLPLDGSNEILPGYALFVEVLAEELGIEVELYEASQSPAIIEAMRSDKVQVGSLTTFSYVLAKSKMEEKLELVGSTIRSADAEPGVQIYALAAAENSAMQSLEDAKDQTICFGQPSSTGTLFLAAGISKAGLDANLESSKDIKPLFVGDGINSAYGVKNGDCSIGYLVDGNYFNALPATEDLEQSDFRIIWKSEKVPSAALVLNSSLPQSLKDRIREIALTQINKTSLVESGRCESEKDCQFLSQVNWGWKATTDDFYDTVRETCRLVESEICGF